MITIAPNHTLNHAERIASHTRNLAQPVWGLVVYRCSYESDEAWKRFQQLLNEVALNRLSSYNAASMTQNLQWIFMEDASMFDDATASTVRSHFHDWCRNESATTGQNPGTYPNTARYLYCMQVDKAVLESVLTDSHNPVINIIDARWGKPADFVAQGHPPIDGVTAFDVGWTKVALRSLLPEAYSILCAPWGWDTVYRRPPAIFDD